MGIGKRVDEVFVEQASVIKKDDKQEQFLVSKPIYSIDDLILPASVKDKILDIASYAENSVLVFDKWGLERTHKYSKKVGINLWGPPGTGKTMAAHAIAEYLGRNLLIVNYADIESKYVGETPKNICKAFEVAKRTNSILFFDEADAMLSKRVTNMTHATDVSVNQTRSVLLMLLNDYQDIILFATNFIENFDPAFMRRILMHVKFELPDEFCRYHLWKKYIPDSMPNNFNIEEIAHKYEGLSGSDISNAVLTAAFSAARQEKCLVEHELLEQTVKNILDSKKANRKKEPVVVTRPVSEEYVKKQLKVNDLGKDD